MQTSGGHANIRPMGLADILDGSIRMYRHNFGSFLGIVAIAWAPALALQLFSTHWFMSVFMTGPQPDTDALPLLAGLGGMFLASVAVYAIAVPLAEGALIWAISKRYLGQAVTITDAYRVVLSKFGQILLAIVLTALIAVVGLAFCVIPGLVFAFMLSFTIPEVVLGNRSAVDAIRRSWELVSFDFWKAALTLFVLGLLVAMLGGALAAPSQFITLLPVHPDSMILLYTLSGGVRALIQVVLQPVQIIGTILLYYDFRIRKEGFDIQLLAQAIEKRDTILPAARVTAAADTSLLAESAPRLPPKIDRSNDGQGL